MTVISEKSAGPLKVSVKFLFKSIFGGHLAMKNLMAQSRPFQFLLICAAACKDEANWFFTPGAKCSKLEIIILDKLGCS